MSTQKHAIKTEDKIYKKIRTSVTEHIKINENYNALNRPKFTGNHETEMSAGGEADLENILTECKKNPGHVGFIPLRSFNLIHLPPGHRDPDMYEFIKLLADMTVRVSVRMTSPHRPEFWPDTKFAYPFVDMAQSKYLRTGTGKVWGLAKYTNGHRPDGNRPWWMDRSTCPCRKCTNSNTPSPVWWEITVYTATHVVFDDVEACHTSFTLFHDGPSSERSVLDQVTLDYASIREDRCRLSCVTCDTDLGDRLYAIKKRFNDTWLKVHEKYKQSKDVDRLVIIVSHPHGCFKQVSVGHWTDRFKEGADSNYKFIYTTCTCPGSSGATVYCVGYSWWWGLYPPVHSGTLSTGLNYSGVGWADG